ncbi:MAG: SIS domain-containing protein [Phycisphaerales bacterium]|jgi:D-sedoheptulose 7-phosphate isomerase|nr:SIS domain-containing protein [Phycisphaerales bacterium]
MKTLVTKRLESAAAVVDALHNAVEDIEEIASTIIDCFSSGGTLMVAGNGGSSAQAMHICEELTGRYRETRPALPAICLCSDAAAMTCIANDFGWEEVFKRQVEAHASFTAEDDESISCDDVLLILTTSGESPNINAAVNMANQMGMVTIGLLGSDGGKSADICNQSIIIEADDSAAIQDGHQIIIHAICEIIDAWVAEEMAASAITSDESANTEM